VLVKIARLTRRKPWRDWFRGYTVTTSPEGRNARHPARPTEPDATPCRNALPPLQRPVTGVVVHSLRWGAGAISRDRGVPDSCH
jgi:hypothetical protein